jgi:cupin superfamily acireductone dioxygenase involved in methionine salvage
MIKDDILESINKKEVKLIRNFFDLDFSWEDCLNLYKNARDKEDLRKISFASMSISKTESYSKKLNELIKHLSEIHPGTFIDSMTIIHFISKYSHYIDEIDDLNALELRELFFKENHHDIPKNINKEMLNGVIHSDDVDGFYIQCEGSVIWKIYYTDKILSYVLKKGDVIFVPKFVKHSVDSLEARTAISFAFRDSMI